jgi:endonuclease/exonuclease/phosphatase family metal-dependent hydrolase
MAGFRFTVGQMLAFGRISFDLCNSLLRPLTVPPGAMPGRRSRPRGSAVDARSIVDCRRLRVASWNIHRSYRGEQVRQSLTTLIRTEEPDIVLLQEVPVYPRGPFWGLDQLGALLADYHLEYVTMHRVGRTTSYYSFAETGMVTLSRTAPVAVEAVPLPTVSRSKLGRNHTIRRTALVTRHTLADRVVCVCHLHLENTTGPRGRAQQISHLLDRLDLGPDTTTVLAGDFNTLLGSRETVHGQVAAQGFVPVAMIGRSRLLPALDHFFVCGGIGQRGRTLRLPGSDHRPIIFDLTVAPEVAARHR